MMITQSGRKEKVSALAAMGTAAAMIAQHVCGRATRDAMFLSIFAVDALPRMMIAAAVVSFFALVFTSRLMPRQGPARLVPAAFGASAVLALAEWVVSATYTGVASVALYLHVTVLGPIIISGFWSLINERFDPHQAKRLMGRIGAGATFGGIVGGLLTGWISFFLSVRSMLLVLALLNVICLGGTRALVGHRRRERPRAQDLGAGALSPFKMMRDLRYLRQLAALTGLVAVTSALLDYVFRAEAVATFPEGAQLLRFFAVFYMIAASLAFVVQMTLSQVSLRRLGLAGTVTILPAMITLGFSAGLALSALWRAVILRGADAVIQNSLYRSGYELFYTPLRPDRKRSTKVLIDVGFDRLGQTAASLSVILVLWLAPGANMFLLTVAAVVAAVTLLLTARLDRGYISALASGLQSKTVRLDDDALLDPTTRILWESTRLTRQRGQRLDRGEESSDDGEASFTAGGAEGDTAGRLGQRHKDGAAASPDDWRPIADQLLEAVADLRSNDRRRIRAVLSREAGHDPRLLPHLVPLLARDDVYPLALTVLSRLAPQATGQLLDALLDPRTDFKVRRRLPRVLRGCPTQRAVDGLMLGLRDKRFAVRYNCVRAIMAITQKQKALRVNRGEILQAASRELDVSRYIWATQQLLNPAEDEAGKRFGIRLRRRTSRSLEHVFNVLSLAFDRVPLMLAYRALRSDEASVRGLALEYLDNVLPVDIQKKLEPYLGAFPTAGASTRTRHQIIKDLRKLDPSLDYYLDGDGGAPPDFPASR